MMIIPLVCEPCNPHRAYLRVLGKAVYYALNRRGCPTWTFLFFCAIRPPADDGLPYRELFFLHTKPLSVVPPDKRTGRRCAPFPVRCAFSRWNSVHAALVFSSPQPESFGRGWVLWSSGLAGHAALGGRARIVPPPAFSHAALYFCFSNKVCSVRMPQRTGTNTY